MDRDQTAPVVFLDRDGTLIVDKDYLHDPKLVEFERGAVDGLKSMAALGLRLIVVTNQSGVARGYFDEASVCRVNERVTAMLRPHQVSIDAWYYCPHDDSAACDCRKPATGLLLRAQQDFAVNFADAFVIGDKMSDVEMARAVGARGILVATGKGAALMDTARQAGFIVASDLVEAAEVIAQALDRGRTDD